MTSSGQRGVWLLALCFAAGIGGGHLLARQTAGSGATEAAVAPVGTDPDAPAAAPPPVNTTPAAAATPRPAAAPLPPRAQPIAGYYDELAARATAGDAAAARRLADDLYECATRERQLDMAERLLDPDRRGPGRRPPPDASAANAAAPAGDDFADRRLQAAEHFVANAVEAEKRCAGVDPAKISKSAEWIRQAAIAGDLEAKLCYAIAPNEWNRDVLSPQWVDWAERWNGESAGLVREAFEGGLPEAAAVLSNMYTAWQPRDPRPWSGRLGEDPYWAYAYGLVAQQTLPPALSSRWAETLRGQATRLSSEQIVQANAWAAAARSRIRFQAPATGPAPDNSLCGNVRRAGAR
ncbi:MAG: hypothetical protein BGP24_23510 [Lysobacterales bacterium 69-70]|nr:hypothetical protein [Xanthomonadaceae bacterium]ODU34349.1 MAG: hypothetical protein ABS97_09690 [Xanthomonadaceae bacterium SCN 69-320]ODV22458.1 MAG: hypothetical protein ABT27_01850 [Xanthomonadaceae bacterium SCN 69-25]OJY96255.1 MAG: hypothetical protein BGP24_23510 [Xanthomonadales bacterium 69-70]